jgi:hypothetical protein
MEVSITHDAPTNNLWKMLRIEKAYPIINFMVTINSEVMCISCEMTYYNDFIDHDFKLVFNSIKLSKEVLNEFQMRIKNYKKMYDEKFEKYIISYLIHSLIDFIEGVLKDEL